MTRTTRDPIEEAGGYGTPTAEQEMPPGDAKKFAQPREEEAFDAAGLNQDSPDGETFPAGAPDLSQFGAEDQDSAGEPGAGRFGGTEEQMSSENASTGPGYETADARFGRRPCLPRRPRWMIPTPRSPTPGGRSPRSPARTPQGLPDGSGTDLPESKSPGPRRRGTVRRRLTRRRRPSRPRRCQPPRQSHRVWP